MATSNSCLFHYLIACLCLSRVLSTDDVRESYIVYMGSLPKETEYIPTSHHVNMLESVLDTRMSASSAIIRSYQHSFNGFTAKLTKKEMEKLKSFENVVSVFPNKRLKLQTTRSWDFSGLTETVKRNKAIESDIIIAVLDTGIWPESESFSDKGFGPIPKKWKGQCPDSFPCNKKLIGAKSIISSDSPRDTEGHGTHTASTAAGSSVIGASFYGVAKGIARGGVPSSRIAAYKVCNAQGCDESDVLAGFDNAIKDGVDIISISVGTEIARDFANDSIAIGAFHALEKGIITVHSAGNHGNTPGLTCSVAPWIFSIAASTTDRLILSNTQLGNGETLTGFSVNSDTLEPNNYPLVYGEEATNICDQESATACTPNCLDDKLVKGKIVLCDDPLGTDEVARVGGLAAIWPTSNQNVSYVSSLISSGLEFHDYKRIQDYYSSSKSPVANIQRTTTINDSSAPTVPEFSSRGPNKIASDILKPDISAPGVNILASYSPKGQASTYDGDKRSFNFNIMSGTSMASPHVAGAVAYVKSFNPNWSPSAIKSALMTTARVMSPINNPEAEFAYGVGHIDPVNALNPGLVYETNSDDYINFLCRMGYSTNGIRLIVGRYVSCSTKKMTTTPLDLNYPSFSAKINNYDKCFSITFNRTVTNVANFTSTYKAIVASTSRLKVSVEPNVLVFTSMKESLSFSLTVDGEVVQGSSLQRATLIWSDGVHNVRSPIVIYSLPV